MVQGYVLIPSRYLPIVENGIRLDWNYVDGTKIWKLHEGKPHVEVWNKDQINALRIAQLLEK